MVKVSADTIGMDVKDLRTDAPRRAVDRAGRRVEGRRGAEGDRRHRHAADKKIDELAAAGTIKAERATKLKERVPQAAERAVNHVPGQKAAANAS